MPHTRIAFRHLAKPLFRDVNESGYNWTIKAEYLYANFGSSKSAPGFLFPGAAAVFNNQSRTLDVNIIRMGLNYKF